jgi:alpha-tubulin suppressor-like RCC1 family protein
VRSVAAGKQHTCAVTVDDRVMCWGSNVVGQLGIETGSSEPRVVPLFGRPTGALSATDFTTCVVLEDSWVHCWGAAELTTDVALATIGGDTLTLAQFFTCTL